VVRLKSPAYPPVPSSSPSAAMEVAGKNPPSSERSRRLTSTPTRASCASEGESCDESVAAPDRSRPSVAAPARPVNAPTPSSGELTAARLPRTTSAVASENCQSSRPKPEITWVASARPLPPSSNSP
jgi:hypothetical protein